MELSSPSVEFNVQEFLLSLNTTLCFGMACLIVLCMRKDTNIITEETIEKIGDATIKFIPSPVMNLINRLIPQKQEEEEEVALYNPDSPV